MGKSLGNAYRLADIEARGFSPMALRYFYLTGHYRQGLNFTWKGLEANQKALERLRQKIGELKAQTFVPSSGRGSVKLKKYKQEFLGYIGDDLNVPQALALAWKMIKDKTLLPAEKYYLLLDFDQVFGLKLSEVRPLKVSCR
jgi:cysteinyl-tRNA synthetase